MAATKTKQPQVRERLSLYELGDEVVALENLVAMDEGEWTDEHEALEKELMEKLVAKADAFGGYVRNLEATAAACKAEAQRLSARQKACENRVASLKEFACAALQRMGKTELKGELFTLANQPNNPSVEVTVEAEKLPAEYVRVVPATKEPDKRAILEALQQGVTIEGCSIKRTLSLRIR